ncbi:hypothetical protein NQ315_016159 [Exocentrus adspersus]|uniref:Dynein axonemal assembly factor 1 homolog n=1 Tax=Exocentrus adspersus TaxID=1586481 RepID=A0AAV8VFR5_9CUCU|nr:hypothetical protein NQ315_016159 [Exocentrus adspersus]
MAVTDPCKEKQPKVIDNDLIYKCITSQFPKGELGRLNSQDKMPLDEIEEIRLEFNNILRIDHLWMMTALTKLQLNNNMIEKVENLETLVHLRELDLSFNKISKIENMETLTKLTKLTFFDNLIETIENLDNQKDLTVFSIGRNRIREWKNVYYLRRFSKLTSLNMAHNPCAESKNFREFVAAFLPNLVYYIYVRIKDSEREKGIIFFVVHIKPRMRRTNNFKIIEKEKADAELHSVMFVEYLNSRKLFDQLFESDVEGKALLDLGDEVKEYYDEYEEQFISLCKMIFDAGQKHYQIRKVEVDEFLETVELGKKKNQEESIACMEDFIERKNAFFEQIKVVQQKFNDQKIDDDKYNEDIEKLTDECNRLIHETWKQLMKLELQLFEQVEEVNQNFGHMLGDLINGFVEEAQAIFSQIRALEVNYFENIGDTANRFLTTINMNEDIVIPESLENIMCDKEAVVNATAASHDVHMQVIDTREDTLVNRAKNYVENFNTNLTQEEIKRNRYKLLEINHFLDIQGEELMDLTTDNAIILDIDDLELF